MGDIVRISFPLSRIVQGDLYTANDTDFQTKQKRVFPAGHPKAGQPKITYFYALAIPKIQGHTHWAQTPWGLQIWQFGHAAWPDLCDKQQGSPTFGQILRPDFAWKIEDGDSRTPNKNNRVNANTEGFPGCWVVSCSSSYPPKIIDSGFTPITEKNAVKRGFWVEATATLGSNERSGNPGIYINGEFVMFKAIDKELGGQAVDPRSIAGFGSSAVPSHLTAVGSAPPGGAPGMAPPPNAGFPMSGPPASGFAGVPGAPQLPAPVPGNMNPSTPGYLPGYAPPAASGVPGFAPGQMPPNMPNVPTVGFPSNPPAPGYPTPGAAPVGPGPGAPGQYGATPPQMPPGVTSVPGFLPPTGAALAPAPAPFAPVASIASPGAAGPTMTAAAKGATWADFQARGWTIEAARAQGFVV